MDWNSLGVQAIVALVPVVTSLLVYGIRQLIPKIPRVALPIIALALPWVVTIFTNMVGGHQYPPLLMALLGAAATWLREIVNTFNEHKFNA